MTTLLAFLAALLAVGSIGFWLFSIVVLVVITALVENDEGVWATLVAIGTVAALQFLAKVPLLAFVKIHPLGTALAALGYFAAGASWSVFKWYVFLHKSNGKYEEAKAEFVGSEAKTRGVPATNLPWTGELAAKLLDKLEEYNKYKSETEKINSVPPQARNHKSTLTRWATYWPFSMIGFALNDVVRRAWRYVIDLLQSTYQRISNHVFRGAAADTALALEYKAKQAAAGADGGSTTTRNKRGY
jgi:hypothetical protein